MYLAIGHEYLFWLAGNEDRLHDISSLPFFLHKVIYFVVIFIFWITMSTTPGKLLMGCHIVDADSLQPVSRKQAIIRLAGYFISALPLYLGFVWAAFDKRKQALHDKLAKTLVLYHSDDYASKSIEELEQEFSNESGKTA
ncbi:MAG: RDD family protein [Gammaproteobacteria bacterium]